MYRFAARITELMHVLEDLNKGKYQRTMVTDSAKESLPSLVPGSGKVRHQDHIIRWADNSLEKSVCKPTYYEDS